MVIVDVLTRFCQPRIDVERLAFHIVECGAEQTCRPGTAMSGAQRRRSGVEPGKAVEQRRRGSSRKVKLCKHDGVCNCDLLLRDSFAFECTVTHHGIDRRHHATQHQPTGNVRVRHQCLEDRRRVRESARFDHDAIKPRAPPLVAPPQQILQCLRQVGADFAAQAASGERNDAILARFDQLMIDSDLAELVDDDGGAREFRLTQQMTKYSTLAAAEKAGDHRDRNRVCGGHDGTSGATATCTRLAA